MALALAPIASIGCAESWSGPGPVEIGFREPYGRFLPLVDGDALHIEDVPESVELVYLSLRVQRIDARSVDLTVTVSVAGAQVAGSFEGDDVAVEADGAGHFLLDSRVIFQTERCCYVCRDGLIEARVVDGSGHVLEGEVTGQLVRHECPDATACCMNADACPDPIVAQLCE